MYQNIIASVTDVVAPLLLWVLRLGSYRLIHSLLLAFLGFHRVAS